MRRRCLQNEPLHRFPLEPVQGISKRCPAPDFPPPAARKKNKTWRAMGYWWDVASVSKGQTLLLEPCMDPYGPYTAPYGRPRPYTAVGAPDTCMRIQHQTPWARQLIVMQVAVASARNLSRAWLLLVCFVECRQTAMILLKVIHHSLALPQSFGISICMM